MIFTVSQLKDYLRCPQLSYYAHELRRVPIVDSTAQGVGSIFHGLMALRMKGELGNNWSSGPIWSSTSQASRDAFCKHRLWIPASFYKIEPQWELIQVEQALTSSVISLQGRPDSIIKYNGKFWSLQWKTYTNDLPSLLDKVKLSFHEVAYEHLGRQNGFEPWGGIILGACQKLPAYRMSSDRRTKTPVTDPDRVAVFTTHYLTRSLELTAYLTGNLERLLERMERDWVHQLRNTDQCFGPFGGSRCPYFEVCHGGQSIESDTFKTAEPRY